MGEFKITAILHVNKQEFKSLSREESTMAPRKIKHLRGYFVNLINFIFYFTNWVDLIVRRL